jgi:lipid II:glycine glycyltransferase (peptidoglycan interpeptide bridge formation enzyme)
LGIKTYDFGGADIILDPESELYGVTLFKRGFGGVLLTYDYAKLVVNPLRSKILISISKLQNNKLLRAIYKLLKNAK